MTHDLRRLAITLTAAALAAALAAPATAAAETPDVTHPRPLSYAITADPANGLEGIHVTQEGTAYVTSVFTGAVFRGDTRTGVFRTWLPAGSDGRDHATGIHVDRWGTVLVTGAFDGTFFRYAADGTLLAKRTLAGEHFLNDFAMTRDAVFATDSFTSTVYRADLSATALGDFVPFAGPDAFGAKAEFLNGIVATSDGRWLLVVDWSTNTTWRVDARTGEVREVAVAGGSLGGDGLLLRGRTLESVQTDWATEETFVRTAQFTGDFSAAVVVRDSARVSAVEVGPTTIARDRGRLLWVEGQLSDETPDVPYRVSVVPPAE